MRLLSCGLAVLVLALAGCAQPTAPSAAPEHLAKGSTAFEMRSCQFVVGVVPVDAARVAPHLPSGFRTLAFRDIKGLPPDPRGSGNVVLEMWTCADGHDYGNTFTFVEPPAALRVPGALFHLVKWDSYVADTPLREAARGWGAAVHEGNVTWATFAKVGTALRVDGWLTMNGTHQLTGELAAPTDQALNEFKYAEYQQVPGGLLRWTGTLLAPEALAGGGELAVAPGVVREILGAASAPAYLLGGIGTIRDGTLSR